MSNINNIPLSREIKQFETRGRNRALIEAQEAAQRRAEEAQRHAEAEYQAWIATNRAAGIPMNQFGDIEASDDSYEDSY